MTAAKRCRRSSPFRSPSADDRGQTLVELTLVLPILVFGVAEAFWLLHTAAKRTECARVVFEATRAALETTADGPVARATREGVELRRDAAGWTGRLRCGAAVETLFLPTLGRRSAETFLSPSS